MKKLLGIYLVCVCLLFGLTLRDGSAQSASGNSGPQKPKDKQPAKPIIKMNTPELSADHPEWDQIANITYLNTNIPPPFSFEWLCTTPSGKTWVVRGSEISVEEQSGKFRRMYRAAKTSEYLVRIFFVDEAYGWVIGSEGSILVTYNGGYNWFPQISGTKRELRALDCLDKNHCLVGGNAGTILSTENGGQVWQPVATGTKQELTGVHLLNDHVGWAVGGDLLIKLEKRFDGQWQAHRQKVPGHESLLAVRFTDERTGVVAGSDGIAGTSDGGRTWNTSPVTGVRTILGLVFHGIKGWAIGADMVNYCTYDAGKSWSKCPS